MVTLKEAGDSVEGERIACLCRKVRGPYLVTGTSAHRAQKLVLEGLPVRAWIERPLRTVKG